MHPEMRRRIRGCGMKTASFVVKSLAAGIAIGIGGIAFLLADTKILGSLLFSIGLYMVCELKLNLYTGKICLMPYSPMLVLMLLLNLAGAGLTGLAIRIAKPGVTEKAVEIMTAKTAESPIQTIILSMFCILLVYIGIKAENRIGLILAVTVFVFCGFEHCIANALYLTVSGVYNTQVLLFLIWNIIGNTLAGVIIYFAHKASQN